MIHAARSECEEKFISFNCAGDAMVRYKAMSSYTYNDCMTALLLTKQLLLATKDWTSLSQWSLTVPLHLEDDAPGNLSSFHVFVYAV